ncbi:Cob(I)yrinic acid a,c-diamide adenosyltransferase [Lacunisphaera limnophila]|uniref:Corrinoid adenosyltransferase n=1 Tax=Lacunisphaera limnophila TaxID=1838286 RepID=A0A1I7PHM0_9BACT|nr:cob(I)yrinic acid a,c-diamide adenosyltransferase [Lacunisphaera limnophila]AOS43107.1 Cob(I)yrinic acid a,c-diamide adenosyltransferase [Lacunisphaera limnophila]
MPSPSIATRTGDAGTTSLLYGQRVPKDHPQVEAVGTLDEFNVALGVAKSARPPGCAAPELERIQHNLIALMGEVACAEEDAARHAASGFARLTEADLARLDTAVTALEARGLRFDGWATPGTTPYAAALEVARTTARRAERRLVTLATHGRNLRPLLLQFVNRASDLLWLMAREAENACEQNDK